ncbi:MAG: type III pantothenate kinase [Acidobacteriota bacterium]|nr:MAG: type III pantothenate kinase [Acidobacteriota bacterium]
MLLAVDIGNTQIVVGLFDGERLARSWRLASRQDLTSDEFRVLLGGLLGASSTNVHDSVVGSVVPALTAELARALEELIGQPSLIIAPGVRTGVKICTDNPHEVGADRIVNAAAAVHTLAAVRGPGEAARPIVVVDFGTATTLDVVTAEGEYLGGIITAGPSISAEALATRAARLARVELTQPPRVIGRNTVDSIRSGLIYGHAALIEGLLGRIETELGEPVRVVVTGGLSAVIAPLLSRVDAEDPGLTLRGLSLIYHRPRAR